jgi:hypothetical protein
MAKSHGARQQKRITKQKAKRSARRSTLFRRTSSDPAIRLQGAEKWPIVQALAAAELWQEGIGSLAIARREPGGQLIVGVFLVDVFCLGVKNTVWRAGTQQDYDNLLEQMGQSQTMSAITPACLAKIIRGAVEYAESFGFPPHPDFRHASALLDGIDPSTCPHEFKFGKDGRPFYINGPNESAAQAAAIVQRIHAAGGHFIVGIPDSGLKPSPEVDDDSDQLDSLEDAPGQ